MPEALIALGGNVGDVRAILRKAIEIFCDGEEVRLRQRSSDYKTPPWGVTEQPPFVNAAIAVETGLKPRARGGPAPAGETKIRRTPDKEKRRGPRPPTHHQHAYDDLTVSDPDLILPHPRLFERAFVLVPLAEIVPNREVAGRRIADAAQRVGKAGIERLAG